MSDEIEKPEPEVRWANSSVVARYPSGTDPRAAIREVLTVGMERTDGTNALPWWQQQTWWHGSGDGIRVGADLTPPALSGKVPHTFGSDPNSVYITGSRDDAILYACWHRRPMLYEVSVSIEPIDDDVLGPGHDSWRVPKATVRKIHGLTETEVRAALDRMQFELPE